MEWIKFIFVSLAIYNIIVFSMYGLDKSRAKRGAWRISEKTLLLEAIIMGGLGAYLGMKLFRHKTKHTRFKIIVPVCMFIQIASCIVIIYKAAV